MIIINGGNFTFPTCPFQCIELKAFEPVVFVKLLIKGVFLVACVKEKLSSEIYERMRMREKMRIIVMQ